MSWTTSVQARSLDPRSRLPRGGMEDRAIWIRSIKKKLKKEGKKERNKIFVFALISSDFGSLGGGRAEKVFLCFFMLKNLLVSINCWTKAATTQRLLCQVVMQATTHQKEEW